MKDKKFIQDAIQKPGQLHKDLGVPQGKKIPEAELAAAAEKSGKVGQRARFAETLKGMAKPKKALPWKEHWASMKKKAGM